MTARPPEFRIVPIAKLRPHERTDPKRVRQLEKRIRRRGRFRNPIWVARGSWVILNGHHRVEALLRLGAHRIPVWLLDYNSDAVTLGRWSPGPPITKAQVLRRARSGRRFPIKTTRHQLAYHLPKHPTPLALLVAPQMGLGRPPRMPQSRTKPGSSPRARRSTRGRRGSRGRPPR